MAFWSLALFSNCRARVNLFMNVLLSDSFNKFVKTEFFCQNGIEHDPSLFKEDLYLGTVLELRICNYRFWNPYCKTVSPLLDFHFHDNTTYLYIYNVDTMLKILGKRAYRKRNYFLPAFLVAFLAAFFAGALAGFSAALGAAAGASLGT